MKRSMLITFSALQYNGCKWLGGILRVEKAREHYLSKLQREWQKQPEEPSTTDPDVEPDSAEAMRIPTPASGFIKRKVGLHQLKP